MFKNCKKSVCSTSSIEIRPNTKKVSVFSKHEKNSRSMSAIQGTNVWLRNGGELPLVSVDDLTSNEIPTPTKHLKRQITETVRSCIVPKQITKTLVRHPSEVTSITKEDHTQVSLKSSNSRQEKVLGREKPFLVDKEIYMNIISHFNEQGYTDIYNPDEFSEKKNKTSTSSSSFAKRTLHASPPPEKVHYSEKAKAEILHSIREELRLWKCSKGLND